MKIIEEGRNDLWYVGLEIKCPSCGSKLKLEAGDCFYHRIDETMLTPSWLVDFDCKVCGYTVTIRKV